MTQFRNALLLCMFLLLNACSLFFPGDSIYASYTFSAEVDSTSTDLFEEEVTQHTAILENPEVSKSYYPYFGDHVYRIYNDDYRVYISSSVDRGIYRFFFYCLRDVCDYDSLENIANAWHAGIGEAFPVSPIEDLTEFRPAPEFDYVVD